MYEPYGGGFRAALAADFGTLANGADLGKVWAVALNGSGKVVKVNGTAGQTHADCVGLMILTMEKYAGDVVDIMTDGQIVDIAATDGIANPATGGLVTVKSTNDGTLVTAQTLTTATNYTQAGRFVEANRLVVRVRPIQAQ